MENLFGNNIMIIYFIVGLGVICYNNFSVTQRIMIIYAISYFCCLFNIINSKNMLVMVTILLFVFLEYLSEDTYKLKLLKKFPFKIVDCLFLLIFQYHYIIYLTAILLQTNFITKQIDVGYYEESCIAASILLCILCIHEVSIQKFQIATFDQIMEKFDKNPVYLFPYDKINDCIYTILTEMEDKSYFYRMNSYNFISFEFLKYRLRRFKEYIINYHWKERAKRTVSAVRHYMIATKHIRGYSTLEMQLMRNIGINNGYNCVIRRKVFEFVYSKIFLTSLKMYYNNNYYSNRKHFKEYLIWVYLHTVKTRINGIPVQPLNEAFENNKLEKWSLEGLFVACMGLSNKGKRYYFLDPYDKIIEKYGLEIDKIIDLYDNFEEKKLK